jgi:RHS repeat-associated protein
MSLVYNSNKFQYAVSQSLPFGEVRRGFPFNAFNCMKAYSYSGERYGYYGYDASGERTYKYDMYTAGSWTNQTGGMNVSLQIDKMMLYPNGYLNMNQNGEYTKHYYADALRIASKIGNGFSQNLCYEANQIGDDIDPNYLEDRRDKQYDEMMEELTELINGNQITDINPIPYPEANLCNLFGDEREDALFFYHPDHLGSTGMVTDNSSNITQGMLYAPFGEIICDYNPTFHDSPMPNYAFNAKELDEENNMYYYSARYYAPPTFISRDPMFEKYPSISPYTYCANNPMKFVDPDGRAFGAPDRVAAARSMTGIPYKQEGGALRIENTSAATAYMDCAEFVCRVMAADQITDGVKSMNTAQLKTYFDNSGKFEHSDNAQVGDVAVWKGHVGIVTEVGENGTIKLTHARGEGKNSKENGYAIKPEQYKNSKFYGYYRPKNETPDGKLDNTDNSSSSISSTQSSIGPAGPPKMSEKWLNTRSPITSLVGKVLENLGY